METFLKRIPQAFLSLRQILKPKEKKVDIVIFHYINKPESACQHSPTWADKVEGQIYISVVCSPSFNIIVNRLRGLLAEFEKARFTVRWLLASRGTGPHINGRRAACGGSTRLSLGRADTRHFGSYA